MFTLFYTMGIHVITIMFYTILHNGYTCYYNDVYTILHNGYTCYYNYVYTILHNGYRSVITIMFTLFYTMGICV